MHELSLTQSLVEIATEHARRAGATAIRSITIEVGDLSGALPEALEFAFDVCRTGTLAAAATLNIRRVAGRGLCRECTADAEVAQLTAVCPACGALAFELVAGLELRVLELEID
jgi:hydrogenase nickel incorporation protein HypA/HybF